MPSSVIIILTYLEKKKGRTDPDSGERAHMCRTVSDMLSRAGCIWPGKRFQTLFGAKNLIDTVSWTLWKFLRQALLQKSKKYFLASLDALFEKGNIFTRICGPQSYLISRSWGGGGSTVRNIKYYTLRSFYSKTLFWISPFDWASCTIPIIYTLWKV